MLHDSVLSFCIFLFSVSVTGPSAGKCSKDPTEIASEANPFKKSSTAGDNVTETMMYTYHIPNRTDCNGPRLYQAYQ